MIESIYNFAWDVVLPTIGLLCVFFTAMMAIIIANFDKDCTTESDLYEKHKK